MSSAWTRVVIMTPGVGGADGISAVTRMYAHALAAQIGAGLGAVELWTLAERPADVPALDAGVTVHAASGSRVRFARFALRATRAGRRTLVIVQHVHLLPVALPLAWRGARVMLQLHGVEAWQRLRTMERAGCRAAWKIISVSAYTAVRFREANPEFAQRSIDVCPPGLPMLAAAAGSAGVRGPYALIVGRMASGERYKGHDLLIDVWHRIRKSVPDARLVVVGGGDDRGRLADKAAGLGLSDAVCFEGVVSRERLAALYREASVFVMPSANEGFGLVYVEAMAAGIPCVVATGAAEEIVEDGATGVVVAPNDAAGLERAIVRLMTNRDERDRMGAAAADMARRRFSAPAFAARLYSMLQLPQAPARC